MKRGALLISLALLTCGVCACGRQADAQRSSTAAAASTSTPAPPLRWRSLIAAPMPVDLAGPRPDGSLVLAAAGKLQILEPSGRIQPFAPTYKQRGGEPYIALFAPTAGHALCFGPGTIYALELGGGPGVLAVRARSSHQLVHLRAAGLIDGIAFDRTGGFGYRLLVTINHRLRTTVLAIDCHGHVATVTSSAPRMEGGIVVAPRGFGRFGGDLIAPDEIGGSMYAITPRGRTQLVARSGLPHGQDIGVESEAFVPAGNRFEMLVADRLTPGNPHPGDNLILQIGAAALHGAGVRAGDLLAVSEGAALTDVIHCGPTRCTVRDIANGPRAAHIEGHVAVLPR
ncbi:MAG: hypothetical protein ACR2L9_11365 [Solirubrobacteraceae bacterium]